MTELGLFGRVLTIVLKNGLPIVAVYWFLERPFITAWFLKNKDFFQAKLAISASAIKRYFAIVCSMGISVALYSILAAIGWETFPVGFEGWMDLILTLGTINFTGTQIVQAKDLKLR